MNAKERKILGDYCRWIADALGLRDWTINIMHRHSAEQHAASCELVYGRRHANLYFNSAWMSMSPEEQRETVIHELLHVHLNPIFNDINNIEHSVGQMILNPLTNAVTDRIEFAIDGISSSIAKHFPLPKQPTARKAKQAPAPKPAEAQEAA